jgi:hypothetical protein
LRKASAHFQVRLLGTILAGHLIAAAGFSQSDYRIEVGEEEYVMGPGSSPMDNPMFSVSTGGSVLIFSANGTTYSYNQSRLYPITSSPFASLNFGSQGNFDECGAWLQSATIASIARGWYHAESNCNYSSGITKKSMAYAESVDGGKTWTKPGYPANQIITSSADVANDPNRNSVGDGHVLQVGNYYYLFFWATDNWGVHVARSSISDAGRPGTWFKFYNGSFFEVGLGGKSVPISTSLLSTFVVYNSYLGRYIAIPVFGRWGFAVNQTVGTDALNWSSAGTKTIYPMVSYSEDSSVDHGYNRSSSDKQYYNYSSVISPEGNSETVGQVFYLYYVKLFSGDGFDKRYQMRRKITLSKNTSSSYLAKVALSRYVNGVGQTKISTEIAKPIEGYGLSNRLGYVLPYQQIKFGSLYECYAPASKTYFLSVGRPDLWNWAHCESSADMFVRRVGYQLKNPQGRGHCVAQMRQQNDPSLLRNDRRNLRRSDKRSIAWLHISQWVLANPARPQWGMVLVAITLGGAHRSYWGGLYAIAKVRSAARNLDQVLKTELGLHYASLGNLSQTVKAFSEDVARGNGSETKHSTETEELSSTIPPQLR